MTLLKPLHILARTGDIADKVIVCGDPARVEQIATTILKDSILVNRNRGFIVYTGYYDDIKVSVANHGIGGPSAAIVFEELRMLGAKVIVRLGTAGALTRELKIGDFVVATGAAYAFGGNTLGMYVPDGCMAAVPDFELTVALVESARKLGENVKVGPVFSSDAFYAENPDFAKKWSSRGIIAVEMECASLFTLGLMRGFKAGALLIISNNLLEPSLGFAQAEELKSRVEKAAKIVLEAMKRVQV